jgi:signal transduction histidine kinase
VQLAVVGAGQVIGEMAVLQQAPRNASVRTLRESRLLVITQAMLLRLLMRNAGALREILRTFAMRVQHNETAVMQQAKMAGLGTLAAGLAHQLNNPAAAIVRSAAHLRDSLPAWDRAASELCRLDLAPDQQTRLDALRMDGGPQTADLGLRTSDFGLPPANGAQSKIQNPKSKIDLADPLARSDHEEQLRAWLAGRGVEPSWELVEPLVAAGWDGESLAELSAGLAPAAFATVLRWLATISATHQTLHEITTSAAAISELVQAVQAYSYVDRAPVQNVDLREGLETALVMLRHKLPPGVRVVREYAGDLPRIEAYGGELNQVWTILVDNAIDALGKAGDLRLRAYGQGDDVVVEVRDSGPGIPREIQPRVFDPFFTTKPQGSGTGLGLYIAHNIVAERGQGQITVESKPGDTCFQVILPIRLTQPERASATKEAT